VEQKRPETADRSSLDIDQLRESELQSSIFRVHEEVNGSVDYNRLRFILENENSIPAHVAEGVMRHIRSNLESLGLDRPGPTLIVHWMTGLLRERGYSLGEIPLHSLELSLSDVELSIFHPIGTGAASSQNPEATSQKIGQRIKAQFATRRVYQEEVIQAHDEGRFELLHLGAIDRPHDVFLTPDYLKMAGLPGAIGAPSAGAAKRADVLLGHLVRFTHELQNHFAGHIRWGYLNTLLLPFLSDMSEADLSQFIQQMLFEFGQMDVERGGLPRKVILDLDFDLPRQLCGLPVVGPGGKTGLSCYNNYSRTLALFNEIFLDTVSRGDYRSNPFNAPQVIYHFNQPEERWSSLHQQLFSVAFKFGNPTIAFSFHQRDLGPLGIVKLNDPDFLKQAQTPANLRGFSANSIALNLPRLAGPDRETSFEQNLEEIMDLVATAHRQKRLFISRLMAYGNRGPLQFLRHKVGDKPFLKLGDATWPVELIGLGEAALIRNGSPLSPSDATAIKAAEIVHTLSRSLGTRNKVHKLKMFLCGTRNENVAYRFALLDMRKFGQTYTPYLFHSTEQSHPIYTEGANIFSFTNLRWRERLVLEGRLHKQLDGFHNHVLYLKNSRLEDASLCQKVFQEARDSGISQLQLAPDLRLCMSCFQVMEENGVESPCDGCKSTMVVSYGYCQSNFSPVHTWCLGKRAEWKIRQRLDDYRVPFQTQLPLD